MKLSWETAFWKISGLNINSVIIHGDIDYFHGALNLRFNKQIQSSKTALS